MERNGQKRGNKIQKKDVFAIEKKRTGIEKKHIINKDREKKRKQNIIIWDRWKA